MMVATLITFTLAMALYLKSRLFLSYLKKNHPKIYFDRLGLINGPFGTMQNGVGFIRYVYSQDKKESKEIINKTKSYKKYVLFFLISLAIFLVCSTYLYVRFNGVDYIG